MSRVPQDRFVRRVIEDRLQGHHRRLAGEIDVDPDQWPWRRTTDGIEAAHQFMASVEEHGVDWGIAWLDEQADRHRRPGDGPSTVGPSLIDERSPAITEAVPECTPENVIAERARRIRDGEPYGVEALAGFFLVHASTIRRRLGTLK